jgi:hypothetical protein
MSKRRECAFAFLRKGVSRKGLAISSGIAKSAVNQVDSARIAKMRQMRWADDLAHALSLVRVADLNGEPSVESFTPVTQFRPILVERIDKAFYGPAA